MDMRERVYRATKFEQPDKVPSEIHYDIRTVEKYRSDVEKLVREYPNHFPVTSYTPLGNLKVMYKAFKKWGDFSRVSKKNICLTPRK